MEWIEQLAAVGVVLFFLAALLWWFRRRGLAGPLFAARTPGKRLESIERLPLGPQHTLHLVRLGEKALVVASSPAGVALLESVEWREIEGPLEAAR